MAAKKSGPRKPGQFDTGAPPARMKPGDFVVYNNSGLIGILHAVFPAAGSAIKTVDVWCGGVDETGSPFVETKEVGEIELFAGQVSRLD